MYTAPVHHLMAIGTLPVRHHAIQGSEDEPLSLKTISRLAGDLGLQKKIECQACSQASWEALPLGILQFPPGSLPFTDRCNWFQTEQRTTRWCLRQVWLASRLIRFPLSLSQNCSPSPASMTACVRKRTHAIQLHQRRAARRGASLLVVKVEEGKSQTFVVFWSQFLAHVSYVLDCF